MHGIHEYTFIPNTCFNSFLMEEHLMDVMETEHQSSHQTPNDGHWSAWALLFRGPTFRNGS